LLAAAESPAARRLPVAAGSAAAGRLLIAAGSTAAGPLLVAAGSTAARRLPVLAGSAGARRLPVPVFLVVPALSAAADPRTASLVAPSDSANSARWPASWRVALPAGESAKISSRQITTPTTSNTAASALTPIAR
jgi:hypothetical protein